MRFRARQAGSLLTVSVHVKATTFQETKSGNPNQPPSAYSDGGNYGYGNGGNIRVRVFTESGSGPNFSNEVARSQNKTTIRTTVGVTNEVVNFNLYKPDPNDPNGVDTSKRLVMTASAKYHIVFENDAADPINNFASINWGHNASSPRLLNPPQPWSAYWSDERVYKYRAEPSPSHSYPQDYAEAQEFQPAFQLNYIPTGTTTQVFWGPINLLSSTKLKTTLSPTGGIVPVDGVIKVRQKFRVENQITVNGMQVASAFFNPASPDAVSGILRVTLQDSNLNELARADYGTGDFLNTNSKTYFNSWDNQVADGVYQYVGKALRNAAGATTPITLVSGNDYYLSFARISGNVTFLINIGQEPFPDGYWTNGNYTPEDWATANTAAYCAAQWNPTGSGWVDCSLYKDPSNILEVRARLTA